MMMNLKKGGENMTAQEAFEKYKHLDENLSDPELVPTSFWGSIILDLWSAIKSTTLDYRQGNLTDEEYEEGGGDLDG
jgi:hypothetical protein